MEILQNIAGIVILVMLGFWFLFVFRAFIVPGLIALAAAYAAFGFLGLGALIQIRFPELSGAAVFGITTLVVIAGLGVLVGISRMVTKPRRDREAAEALRRDRAARKAKYEETLKAGKETERAEKWAKERAVMLAEIQRRNAAKAAARRAASDATDAEISRLLAQQARNEPSVAESERKWQKILREQESRRVHDETPM